MDEVSVKSARENLAEIVSFVAFGNKTYQINKYGKPQAIIISISTWNDYVKLSSRFKIVD
jgi:PHD/YefM family antitoxin component YafN of YafNO toxin-antitoxin module